MLYIWQEYFYLIKYNKKLGRDIKYKGPCIAYIYIYIQYTSQQRGLCNICMYSYIYIYNIFIYRDRPSGRPSIYTDTKAMADLPIYRFPLIFLVFHLSRWQFRYRDFLYNDVYSQPARTVQPVLQDRYNIHAHTTYSIKIQPILYIYIKIQIDR